VAKKLGMNTDIRKKIFLVVMSSRDVTDAFERLARLDLKGKQDREVARVVAECCGSEKHYNEFYPELAALFCMQNRQYKITLQYAFWDLFKILCEEDSQATKQKTDRRAINMARMLAHLTVHFHLSLSVLKVIDIAEISSSMLLFLATYFMSLFSAKVSHDTEGYTTLLPMNAVRIRVIVVLLLT
jgi:nucleolar MIF4G domain-containing protein 1